ncbi:unnamed protein product [Cochlearia groenlandica]
MNLRRASVQIYPNRRLRRVYNNVVFVESTTTSSNLRKNQRSSPLTTMQNPKKVRKRKTASNVALTPTVLRRPTLPTQYEFTPAGAYSKSIGSTKSVGFARTFKATTTGTTRLSTASSSLPKLDYSSFSSNPKD